MKKLSLIFAAAIMMTAIFVSCNKKDNVIQPNNEAKKVAVIDASYFVKNGDLMLKSAPTGTNVNLGMLTKNPTFYTGTPTFGGTWWKVDGRELITGTVAQIFWANPLNNFSSFPLPQPGVYSNQTPDEPVRIVAETRDASNAVVYLGMVDFNPSIAGFPLTINGFRLGDELVVNADAIKNLPGGQYLTITASFNLAPINLLATESIPSLSGSHSAPSGSQFEWSDIVYGTAVPTTVTIGAGDFSALNTLAGKIIGSITITLTVAAPNMPISNISLATSAMPAGQGLKLTLTTNKIGWFDSGTMTWVNTDITITSGSLPFN